MGTLRHILFTSAGPIFVIEINRQLKINSSMDEKGDTPIGGVTHMGGGLILNGYIYESQNHKSKLKKKMLESRPEDALVKLVKLVKRWRLY